MPLFTSSREKHLWAWAFVVFVAIFSTLFIGRPFANLLRNQDIQALLFFIVMTLIGITTLVHSLKAKPGKIEITVMLGIIAVYIMLFLRLGIAERSHLLEYSVLAIFIHNAIMERLSQGKQITMPALTSIIITVLIGVLDECIQIFLPNRVFDPIDIVFNSLAVIMAIGSSELIKWLRKRIIKSKLKKK